MEHAQKETDWAAERQQHNETLNILRAQIGASEKRKSDAFEALKNMTRKSELFEDKWKGMESIRLLYISE